MIHRQTDFTQSLVHKDTEGRYILVNGLNDGINVSLMNIYAPNEDEPGFIRTLCNVTANGSTTFL